MVIWKDFYSEGDGMGSSFFIDFPVYNRRKTISPSVVVPADNNVGLFTNISQPEIQQSISFLSAGVTAIGRAGDTSSRRAGVNIEVAIPLILIVDDSSANR